MINLFAKSVLELVIDKPLEDKEVHFYLDAKTYDEQDIDKIIQRLSRIKEQGFDVMLIINAEQRNFDSDEIAVFISLKKKMDVIHVELFFDGGYKDFYTLPELIHTDKVLDEFINKLNASGLSPFEKYMVIYRYLTKKLYKVEDDDNIADSPHLSRDIISVITTDYIVCQGYAELMQYLCTNVGIECFTQVLSTDTTSHMNNFVNIHDDKYGIHGLYYADACWDTRSKTAKARLNYCLLPLDDVRYISSVIMPNSQYLPLYRVRNYKLICDVFFPYDYNNSYNLSYFYLIEKFHLEKETEEWFKKCADLFLKEKDDVIDTLFGLLQEQGVRNRDYVEALTIPYGTSIPFLLALLILSKNNLDTVRYQISVFKRYIDLGADILKDEDNPFANPFSLDMVLSFPLIEGFEMLKHGFNYQEMDMTYEGFTNILYKELDFDHPLEHRTELSTVFDTISYMRNMIILDKLEKLIEKEYPRGLPVSIKAYEEALKKALLYEGMSEQDADKLVKSTIKDSIDWSESSFFEGATNSFYKKALERRKGE